jgi:hypothetical protein
MRWRELHLRAVLVAVDYADILEVTLAYNRHHFYGVTVVTSSADMESVKEVCRKYQATIYATDAFYANGATFNKWAAVEEALDSIGRNGWLCLMDADVLWPKVIPEFSLEMGKLYTPSRRMGEIPKPFMLLPEERWKDLSILGEEFAGYSQIFHADDPHLGNPPWHELDWLHAGGADTAFQNKWPDDCKIRPPFEVLHLGPAWANWWGRTTDYLDGNKPKDVEEKRARMREMFQDRDKYGFEKEKLSHG